MSKKTGKISQIMGAVVDVVFDDGHQLSSSAMSEKPDKMEALENRRKREKDARDRETDEEKEARRLKRREHEKSNRSQETEEQASARRTARRESERKRRESKSSEERSATNLKRRQDHANKVQAQKEAAGVTSIVGVREISSSSVSDTVHVSLLADAAISDVSEIIRQVPDATIDSSDSEDDNYNQDEV